MSIFAMVTEGKQADEYRERKQYEKDHSDDAGNKRFGRVEKTKENKNSYEKGALTGNRVGELHDHDKVYFEKEPGSKMNSNNPNFGIKHPIKTYKGMKDDDERAKKASNMYFTDPEYDEKGKIKSRAHHGSNPKNGKYERNYAIDAANRHLRRHPTKESFEFEYETSLFSECNFI